MSRGSRSQPDSKASEPEVAQDEAPTVDRDAQQAAIASSVGGPDNYPYVDQTKLAVEDEESSADEAEDEQPEPEHEAPPAPETDEGEL
jgi:hypothetical protein